MTNGLDLSGFSEQGKIDYLYGLPFETKGVQFGHLLAGKLGGTFEARFKDHNFRDGLLHLPDGREVTIDVKACRTAKDFPFELYRGDGKTKSSAFMLDLALFHLEAEGRWFLVNVGKWRKVTDNFKTVESSHPLRVVRDKVTGEPSAHVKWFSPAELARRGCSQDVTKWVQEAQQLNRS